MLDVAVLGLQAATLQVLRVDACDTALQHLGASISTRDIHAAASQLCMHVLAGTSPPAQAMLLRAMPELRDPQPGARPFRPAGCLPRHAPHAHHHA